VEKFLKTFKTAKINTPIYGHQNQFLQDMDWTGDGYFLWIKLWIDYPKSFHRVGRFP